MVCRRLLLLSVCTLVACGEGRTLPSEPAYDAAFSVAADGTIDDGRLVATTNAPDQVKAEIQGQLWYLVGVLNGHGGVVDMARLQTTVTSVTARQDGLFDVAYEAKLFVSWPSEADLAHVVPLTLPARGDDAWLGRFLAAYGADEQGAKACLDDAAHDVGRGNFWYYFRPFKSTCTLRQPRPGDDAIVRRAELRLTRSAENTSGKFPEYGKVWEDGTLVVTAIFGKYEAGATGLDDAGIDAFRRTFAGLLQTFGAPQSSNLPRGVEPDAGTPDVRLVFRTAAGPLDVHLYLVDELQAADAAFRQKYDQRTRTSDFVSYSGHSGLGANIRALATMGQFEKGQYQLFMVNGCDTFAYVDTALRDAHLAVNPGAGADKYFDLITNSMPAYFNQMARANLTVIRALVERRSTYREILGGFDPNQRPAVTGEEDNAWPAPFGGQIRSRVTNSISSLAKGES